MKLQEIASQTKTVNWLFNLTSCFGICYEAPTLCVVSRLTVCETRIV